MNIIEAYEIINSWVKNSKADYIDIGGKEKYSFTVKRIYSDLELSDFESESGFSLPRSYKNFLKSVGAISLFEADKYSGINFLSPWEVKDFSRSVFLNFGDDLYPELFLTTSVPRFGCFGGFFLKGGEEDNYGIFYPDTPPELWIEEAEFTSFDDWIINLVEHKSPSKI